ncbi:DNA/RNA helicase domain-containing protein, partial [Pseudomonas aeruginosa]|uniref:DNA/RNA helicase domain-containing protein n=1 Tax=Pseudomonas aeruginosa TaxID=287 RepID=UPI0020C6D9D9
LLIRHLSHGEDFRLNRCPGSVDHYNKSIRGYKKLMKENPELARKETDLIIKNTYRTLMTRGMKGCYVFCTDEETARYFRGRGGR